MIEIGLMFYSQDIAKDLEFAIKRYEQHMEKSPQMIFLPVTEKQHDKVAGLETCYTTIPKHHFILAEAENVS